MKTQVKPITFRKEGFTVLFKFYYFENSWEGFTDSDLEDLNINLVFNS